MYQGLDRLSGSRFYLLPPVERRLEGDQLKYLFKCTKQRLGEKSRAWDGKFAWLTRYVYVRQLLADYMRVCFATAAYNDIVIVPMYESLRECDTGKTYAYFTRATSNAPVPATSLHFIRQSSPVNNPFTFSYSNATFCPVSGRPRLHPNMAGTGLQAHATSSWAGFRSQGRR